MIIIRLQGNILHRLCRRVAFDISGVQILHSGSEAYNEKIKLLLCICILLTGILFPAQTVQASSSAIGDVAEFNNLSGNAKYLGVDYRDNYSLDIVETDISDGIGAYFSGMMANALNGMANALFFLERILSYLTVVVFYVSFNLNLIDLFGNQVSTIQQALNNSIFQPLFYWGVQPRSAC